MTLDLRAIRELCEKATPGPWTAEIDQFSDDEGAVATVTDRHVMMLVKIEMGMPFSKTSAATDTQETRDARHIAAFSPSTALALLDRVEELERALVEACDIATYGLDAVAGEVGHFAIHDKRDRLTALRAIGQRAEGDGK